MGCGEGVRVHFWCNLSFTFLETITGHKSSVEALTVCPQEDYFVSAGRDSTVIIWSSKTLRPEVLAKRVGVYSAI